MLNLVIQMLSWEMIQSFLLHRNPILKLSKESIFLKFSGRRPQIFDPKKDIFSVPWNTVLTKGVENWEMHRKLYGCSASGSDTPFIMGNEIPLLILNISVTRTWRFLLCIETEPSFSTCDLSIPNLVQQSKILSFDLPCFFPFQVCYLVKSHFIPFFFVYITMANNTDFIYLVFIHYESKKEIREINTFNFLIAAFELITAFKLPTVKKKSIQKVLVLDLQNSLHSY